jgi:hypothetical protein
VQRARVPSQAQAASRIAQQQAPRRQQQPVVQPQAPHLLMSQPEHSFTRSSSTLQDTPGTPTEQASHHSLRFADSLPAHKININSGHSTQNNVQDVHKGNEAQGPPMASCPCLCFTHQLPLSRARSTKQRRALHEQGRTTCCSAKTCLQHCLSASPAGPARRAGTRPRD